LRYRYAWKRSCFFAALSDRIGLKANGRMDVSANQAWMKELNAPFALRDAERSFYTENGYIKLRQVLPAKLLEHYRVHISAKVAELSADKLPLDQRSTYDKAFLQVGNLWLVSAEVREFVFGR